MILKLQTVGLTSAGVLCVSETSSGCCPGLAGDFGLLILTFSSTSIGYKYFYFGIFNLLIKSILLFLNESYECKITSGLSLSLTDLRLARAVAVGVSSSGSTSS